MVESPVNAFGFQLGIVSPSTVAGTARGSPIASKLRELTQRAFPGGRGGGLISQNIIYTYIYIYMF